MERKPTKVARTPPNESINLSRDYLPRIIPRNLIKKSPLKNADNEFMNMAVRFKETLGRDVTQFQKILMSEKHGELKDRLGPVIMQDSMTEIT